MPLFAASATLKIGDKIPIATGSFQSGVGTVGGAPYAQTQFQFTDVGIKVEITPQVHSADELTMHVSFEVSTVRSYTDIGGVQQPIIGQRTEEADVRLREGEVNILAGLDGVQDSSVVSGIPGLVNIPILGKILFGSDHIEKDRQQLMIALVPHIVRTPDYTPENLRGIYSGPDQSLRLMYAPRDEDGSAPAVNAPAPGVGQTPAAAPQAPAIQPPALGAPGTPPLPVPPVPPGAGARVVFVPGELLARSGGAVSSIKDIRNDSGEATLNMSRAGGAGVSGSGPVVILNFVAVAPGTGSLTVTEMGLKNSQSQAIPVTLGSVSVAVK